MGYWTNCSCCNREIGYEDYRESFGDEDKYYCYNCTQEIQEVIEKFCNKYKKES